MEVYGQSSQTIEKLLRTRISTTQVYRITDTFGELIEQEVKENIPVLDLEDSADKIYVQMDGGMIFTKDKWKEVKVGRIFKQSDVVNQFQTTDRQYIKRSIYVAHLGGHHDFLSILQGGISAYKTLKKKLVFINDGAVWIDNWIKQNYPRARSILDYYHLTENIAKVGKLFLKDKAFEDWFNKNKEDILESQSEKVIDSILRLKAQTTDQVDAKMKLIRYITKNRSRINYKLFRKQGLQIGSGAIEASHRTVVQKRMKKSGQVWSNKGAQKMLNLRVAFKSERWNIVIDLVKKNAA